MATPVGSSGFSGTCAATLVHRQAPSQTTTQNRGPRATASSFRYPNHPNGTALVDNIMNAHGLQEISHKFLPIEIPHNSSQFLTILSPAALGYPICIGDEDGCSSLRRAANASRPIVYIPAPFADPALQPANSTVEKPQLIATAMARMEAATERKPLIAQPQGTKTGACCAIHQMPSGTDVLGHRRWEPELAKLSRYDSSFSAQWRASRSTESRFCRQ